MSILCVLGNRLQITVFQIDVMQFFFGSCILTERKLKEIWPRHLKEKKKTKNIRRNLQRMNQIRTPCTYRMTECLCQFNV